MGLSSDKHDAARAAFLDWLTLGKPKFGYHFEVMKKTRATFKLAVRYCKNHIDQLKADACAEALSDRNSRKFWKALYKASHIKATENITTVGDISGSQNIANMWGDHFSHLYNKLSDTAYQSVFHQKMSAASAKLSSDGKAHYERKLQITIQDVITALNTQKRGKACGPDGVHMEAYMYGGHRLSVYLCLFFNLCLQYGFLPESFSSCVISPIVKCSSGNLNDVNNYRAIALSNTVSKIFESVLFRFIDCSHKTDDYQFGFRKNHSTTLCTDVFKRTVDYYTQRGSHVFSCFVDFNKAFDSVDYWHLFCKLIDSNPSAECYLATRVLAYWYSNRKMCVR